MFSINIAGMRVLFTEMGMYDRLEVGACSSDILWGEKRTKTVYVVAIPASERLIMFINDMLRSGIDIHYSIRETDLDDSDCAIAITSRVGASDLPLQRVAMEKWEKPTIVTTNEPIGLIATLVVLGVGYPGIRRDISILTGESGELSCHAKWLFEKWGSIPSLIREQPEIHEEGAERLFRLFLKKIGAKTVTAKQAAVYTLINACTIPGCTMRVDGPHQIR
jgi:hypothetical protein